MRRTSLLAASLVSLAGLNAHLAPVAAQSTTTQPRRLVHADVVALDQLLVYNRFGSFNPFGMMFALRRDVMAADGSAVPSADICSNEDGTAPGTGTLEHGKVMLKTCKRPRPLVLRANVGDELQLTVTNLLRDDWPDFSGETKDSGNSTSSDFPKRSFCEEQSESPIAPVRRQVRGAVAAVNVAATGGRPSAKSKSATRPGKTDDRAAGSVCRMANGEAQPMPLSKAERDAQKRDGHGDWPRTRGLSLAIPGLEPLPIDGKVHGACLGTDAVKPGASFTCRWRLDTESTHLFSSLAAPSGGEGDGGSLSHGLFGALIVEPIGSRHYRSQVTRAAFDLAWRPKTAPGEPHAREPAADPARSSGPIRSTGYDTRKDVAPYGTADNPCRAASSMPVLEMQRACGAKDAGADTFEIVHGDLNALIVPKERKSIDAELAITTDEDARTRLMQLRDKSLPFREFTVIFHDELKTFYTTNFRELERFEQFSGIRDGFAINYGASGAGSLVLANRKKIGPAANCPECLYEEFFLESWANGDPALLEVYPDDPSNVHHSYLNDKVVFRNFHAGKETHVFHLHAHQWFAGNDQNRGGYLDSQTIGPQQGLTYRIYHGGHDRYAPEDATGAAKGWWESLGSGNRNRTVGDSIFHCHLYPHFAQGMWALWRVHDVLEDGTRVLPDGQPHSGLSIDKHGSKATRPGTSIARGPAVGGAGTPIPGLVPMPEQAAPLLPTYGTAGNPGYPFFIAGTVGHRAPQAPLDIAKADQPAANGGRAFLDGGLPRHVVTDGKQVATITDKFGAVAEEKIVPMMLALGDITAKPKELTLKILAQDGEPVEKQAMAFHHDGKGLTLFDMFGTPTSHATGTYTSQKLHRSTGLPSGTGYFAVNGSPAVPGAPFADPCGIPAGLQNTSYRRFDGISRMISGAIFKHTKDELASSPVPWLADPGMTGFRRYEASAIQMNMVVNRAGWHDPQARINVLTQVSDDWKNQKRSDAQPFFFRAFSGECIEFRHTNETPKDLDLDDFQLKVPTDTIGQHIHLVKFDVTSADGSGNGFNYEDGTFAPDEILARICEAKKVEKTDPSHPDLADRTAECAALKTAAAAKDWKKLKEIALWKKKLGEGQNRKYFQTTVQRWFADPILSNDGQKGIADRTLRTVFTHDHFAPSNIQQHGFYNALLVEPMGHDVCLNSRPDQPDEHGDGKTCRAGPALVAGATAPPLKLAMPLEQAVLVGARASVLLKKAPPGSTDCTNTVIGTWTDQSRPKPEYRCDIAGRIVWSSAYGNPVHPDAREYAISIADFATLYDGQSATLDKVNQPEAKGLDRLVREFECKFAKEDRDLASAEYEDPLEVPSVAAGRCKPTYEADGKLGTLERIATVLPKAAIWLRQHADEYRKFGRPIAPPFRPEAISQKHHDPYLVNYRTEPIPLRIGANTKDYTKKENPLETSKNPCYLPNEADRRTENHGNIKHQWRAAKADAAPKKAAGTKTTTPSSKEDETEKRRLPQELSGDMAAAFSSEFHADPCTPILESYDDERVSVRLIQGAQEVQHTLTVAGQTFRRQVDQAFPAAAALLDQRAVRSRSADCADNPVQRAGRPRQAFGWENNYLQTTSDPYWSNYTTLIANCDNPSGTVTAQEIGISEHFELNSTFDAGRTTARARALVASKLSGRTVGKSQQLNDTNENTSYRPTFVFGARPLLDSHYSFGSQDALWNGAWGLIRTYHTHAAFDWAKCMQGKAGQQSADEDCRKQLAMFVRAESGARRGRADTAPQEKDKLKRAADGLNAALNGPAKHYAIGRRLPSFDALRGTPAIFQASFTTLPTAGNLCEGLFAGSVSEKPPVSKTVIAVVRRRELIPATGIVYRDDLIDPDGIVIREVPYEVLFPTGQPAYKFASEPLLQKKTTILQYLRNSKVDDTPLTLRARAGDCLQIWVVNLLPTGPFTQFGPSVPRDPLSPRIDADARMPLIVPLNSGAQRERKPDGPGDVLTSSQISLSIPLLQLEPGRDSGFAIGLGKRRPLQPGYFELRQYYAGLKRNPDFMSEAGIRVGTDVVPYAFGALPIRAMADVVNHPTRGMIGAVVVEGGQPSAPTGPIVTVDYRKVAFTSLNAMQGLQPTGTAGAQPQPISASVSPSARTIANTFEIPAAIVRTHTLFWQDGLNLWHRKPDVPLQRDFKNLVVQGRIPVPDCPACDDSYDFGEKGVSYRSEPFTRRLVGSTTGQDTVKSDLGLRHYPNDKTNLNGFEFPRKFFSSSYRPPATPMLLVGQNEQTVVRVVHAGGRARQRAFVLYGAGYYDLFPGFGSPHSSLLAPGKAIAASFCTPEKATGDFIYRDGPQPIFAAGVWGLVKVSEAQSTITITKCGPGLMPPLSPVVPTERTFKVRGLN